MSQFALSLRTLSLIYQKATTYQYRTTVDAEYCSALKHSDSETERWLFSLACLNGWRAEDLQELRETITGFYRFKVDCFQMVKWLHCLNYNLIIRELTEQEKKDVDRLHKAIREIEEQIIAQTVDYETAGWADEPSIEKPRKSGFLSKENYYKLESMAETARRMQEEALRLEKAMEVCQSRTPLCRTCKKYSECDIFARYSRALRDSRTAKQHLADEVINMFNF